MVVWLPGQMTRICSSFHFPACADIVGADSVQVDRCGQSYDVTVSLVRLLIGSVTINVGLVVMRRKLEATLKAAQ
jgi:hypothetical protein